MQEIATVDKQLADAHLAHAPSRSGRSSRDRAVAEAVARERRRIAADVHDLVMQDLAFALASARSLASRSGGEVQSGQVKALLAAGERAMAGARRVVDILAQGDRRPVVEAVHESVQNAAREVPLSFDARGVADGEQPDGPTLEALVHIAREAVTNAVKHADADAIEVVLQHGDEWQLRIADDGRGYEPSQLGGFGLASMRRHAKVLGGLLIVQSAPMSGTTVEAILP